MRDSPAISAANYSARELQNAFSSSGRSGGEHASSEGEQTYDLDLLGPSLRMWHKCEALRSVYESIYSQMRASALPGKALEIGAGIGVISEFVPDVTTSDVVKTEYVDQAASAYDLEPSAPGPWATIYMLDVLHHLRQPFRFFESAASVLEMGGRIVMMEPAATRGGRLFFRAFHHEPIIPDEIYAPYDFGCDDDEEFANMAMAWSLFDRDRGDVARRLSEIGLSIHTVAYRDIFAYPATGGFSKPAFLPVSFIKQLLKWESSLSQAILSALGQRMLVVLERAET